MNEHVISDEALSQIGEQLNASNHWMAYNTTSYYLEKHDVYLFNNKEEADEFSKNNISEYDDFKVIKVMTVENVLKQISNKEQLSGIHTEGLWTNSNLNNQKTNFMNQKNFEYLKDQVKFTGFGEVLENELKEKMQKQSPEFKILHNAKFGNDATVATLHFKKSDQSDMYFFNRYNLSVKSEQSPDVTEQTFYINKGNNITLKEGYNLMSGRAINKDLTNKEGQIYNTWMQMDFKQTDNSGNYKMQQFHQNYGFDLEKILTKHPIKELNNEQDKSRLVESLQKGNKQSVTFIQDGHEQKHFIEANPQFKIINVYDSNKQRVVNRQSNGQRETQGEVNKIKQEVKKESQNQNEGEDNPEAPKASKSGKKKQGQTI